MRKKKKGGKAEGRKENSGGTWLSGCVSPLLCSSWNTDCIPTAHWMSVLEPPKALVRANGIPEPLSSKVIEGCSIPRADVPTCNDLSLVACLLSRSLSRDRPQTDVFIPHGKQTQRTEAVRGSPPRESRGIEELWPLALGPDVSWCSGTPGRSPICQPGVLGTLHPGCLRGVVSACVSVEGFPCPYSPGPGPPGATGVAFRTRGSPSILGGRA